MESMSGWNEIERTIAAAIAEHDKAVAAGVLGPSVVQHIYTALKAKGFLKEPEAEGPKPCC